MSLEYKYEQDIIEVVNSAVHDKAVSQCWVTRSLLGLHLNVIQCFRVKCLQL
jgi:hypothetical protein